MTKTWYMVLAALAAATVALYVSDRAAASSHIIERDNPGVNDPRRPGPVTKVYPCYRHKAAAKKECLRQYKRSRTAWPKNPTNAEIKKRVGAYHWEKARRVARCETGKRVRWYISHDGAHRGKYVGALGMYTHTFRYGARKTGYVGRTWAEQVAIAVAAHKITGGWNGWGCRGA